MAKLAGEIAPPSVFLLALEPRGLFSVAQLIAGVPFLAMAPRGTPQAVIVLPGLGATDRSTIAIRRYLKFLGYPATGWNRGRNVRPAGADLPAVAAQIRSLCDATGIPVSLVGWSRGGMTGLVEYGLTPSQGRFHRDDVYMPMTPMFHVHAWGTKRRSASPTVRAYASPRSRT